MWVETVTEGGPRFMAAWRKEVDAARLTRRRERQRDWERKKVVIVRGSVEPTKRHRFAESTSRKKPVRARDETRPRNT